MGTRIVASFALLGCSAGAPDTEREGIDSTGGGENGPASELDTGRDSDNDSASPGDTGGASAPAIATCPVGMVPVPPEAPVYCLDAYEQSEGGLSVAGTEPTVALTFIEAREACARQGVVDARGAVIGQKRLATDAEWEDGADGTVGEGGHAFPYGEEPVEGACVLPDASGNLIYDDIQLTGSLASCVSAFGVYDQVGNAWEWVDPEQASDSAAWLAEAAALAHDLTVGDDGQLRSGDADLAWLAYKGVVFPDRVPYADADGRLFLDGADVEIPNDAFLAGYLQDADAEGSLDLVLLPVTLDDAGDQQMALFLDTARDGWPFTSKRGCAWYTGSAMACSVPTVSHEHPPDFDGTIGFRCASDPIPPGQ